MNTNMLVDDCSNVQVLADAVLTVSQPCTPNATGCGKKAVVSSMLEQAIDVALPVHSEAQVAGLWRESKQGPVTGLATGLATKPCTEPMSNTDVAETADAKAQIKQHSAQDDRHLVSRAVAGDKRAFDLLVLKYQSRIARLIAVYVKDADNVQDVLQETFIRAYKALKQYRSESQFYTWLYRIAVNTSFSFLKANKTWQHKFDTLEEGEDFHEPAAHIDEPDSVMHNQHLNAAIKSAFAALPLKLRTTLALRELEGMSYEDIATVTEVDLGTVKSRLSRARTRVMAKTEQLYRRNDYEQDSPQEPNSALV